MRVSADIPNGAGLSITEAFFFLIIDASSCPLLIWEAVIRNFSSCNGTHPSLDDHDGRACRVIVAKGINFHLTFSSFIIMIRIY